MTDPLLPNFVMPGFPKCGTTSVAETLTDHPDVVGAFPHRASHFFTRLLYDPMATLPTTAEYSAKFAHATGEAIRLDDTVVWAYGGEPLVEAVRNTLGSPKVLVMLREPASRTASYLVWKKRSAEIDQAITLRDYVAECERLGPRTVDTEELNPYSGLFGSEYARFLPSWIDVFGDDLRFGFTDDLETDPLRFYQTLASWLAIDDAYFGSPDAVKIANTATAVRSAPLERVVRATGRKLQPIATTNPRLYRAIRRAATRVNVKPTTSDCDGDTMARLRARFAPSTGAIRSLVHGRTLLELPAWLAAADEN